MPFNTHFGNSEPGGADVVELLDKGYEENTERERWYEYYKMEVAKVFRESKFERASA